MRTARSLTLSHSILWVSPTPPSLHLPPTMQNSPGCRPPVNRMTNRCKNTFVGLKNAQILDSVEFVPKYCIEFMTGDFYRPQRSCGQGNIFTPVCHSFCSQGGGGLPQCMLGYHPPPEQTPPPWSRPTPPGPDPPRTRPPRDQIPPEQTTPPGSRLQHTVYERPVRILLECILVRQCF